jgi:hypothetical protein
MDSFYLLVTARRKQRKRTKAPNGRWLRQKPKDRTRITRVAKCSFDHSSTAGSLIIGRWYKIEIYDSPFRGMLDLVFVGLDTDPCWRTSQALSERMASGLSLASGVKWEANCGPIDAEDAALLRIGLEVA